MSNIEWGLNETAVDIRMWMKDYNPHKTIEMSSRITAFTWDKLREQNTWRRHQMETFSALLALCARGIHRPLVNSPHKVQWRWALVFSLICAWINGWVNNREPGDLSRHCAHYDVIVMRSLLWLQCWHDGNSAFNVVCPQKRVFQMKRFAFALQWRHNQLDRVSDHQPH